MAARRPGSTRSAAAEPVTIRIERVGAEGDGIGTLPAGRPAFVPLTLPGELARVRPVLARGDGWAAVAEQITGTSPDRILPPCPHFGTCGGCVLQHLRETAYREWKAHLLGDALHRAGFGDVPISPIVPTPPGARRRMDLAIRRAGSRVTVGLHRLRAAEVVDLQTCHVLHPRLVALIDPLRRLLRGVSGLRAEGAAVVNLLESGPDVLLRTDRPLTVQDRARLTGFARANHSPRIAWALRSAEPEPVCVLRPPVTMLSNVTITPPPGAFLQASAEGEAAIVAAVLSGLPAHLPARTIVADLYAGCGTLSFALAHRARIAAWEGNAAAVRTLRAGVRNAGLSGRIEAQQRDLARQPLSPPELAGFAAVVLDPPHAGAAVQMSAITAAGCQRVIYVSCSPTALTRDARILRAGGYRVLAATPIDQFLWSARLESVVVFGR